MLPPIATPKQIKSGKTRKHIKDGTCFDCYPKMCSCPQTASDVIAALQSYLSDCKNVLNDEEKEQVRKDIEEAKVIQKKYKI